MPLGWVPTFINDAGIPAGVPESVIRALEVEIVRLETELQEHTKVARSRTRLEEELLTGQVILRHCCPGSKNDNDRVALELDNGNIWLIRRPFIEPSKDDKLYNLLGKRITATGYIHGYCFMVTSVLIRKK